MSRQKKQSRKTNKQESSKVNEQITPQSSENTEKKESNVLISTLSQAAIIVLIATALSYSFTALFKYGYHQYYDFMDYSLLKVDTSDLIHYFIVIFPILGQFFIIYLLLRFIFLLAIIPIKKGGGNHKAVNHFILLFVLYSLYSTIYKQTISSFWSAIIGITFGLLVLKPLYPRKIQSFIDELVTPFQPYKLSISILVVIFWGYCSIQLGYNSAENQKKYLLVDEHHLEQKKDASADEHHLEQIVISNSGDNLITAPYNKEENTINSTFTVIPIKNKITLKTIILPEAIKVSNEPMKKDK